MQYAIPQFIEVEDRVIGPLTIRQFIMLLVGALFTGLGYSIFDFSLFIVSGIFFMGFAALFAFLKINGQKLEKFIGSFVTFSINPKVRLWAKEVSVKSEKIVNTERREIVLKSRSKQDVSRSKLHELSILLDASSREYATRTDNTTTKS